jgi:hypothetical protein
VASARTEKRPAKPLISTTSSRPRAAGRGPTALLWLYTGAILASAFLLFLVEPMTAKMLLPLAGGAPEVWTTAVLFFQVSLLAGYAYVYLVGRRPGSRRLVPLHLLVLAAPLAVLPLHVGLSGAPAGDQNPVPWLLLALTLGVGAPFVALATTSPLLQHWFASSEHPQAHDPYFLYRASNIGSAAGLLLYPLVVERLMGVHQQTTLWSLAYVGAALLIASCAVLLLLRRAPVAVAARVETEVVAPRTPLGWPRSLRWVALAAVPAVWMLGVTTYFTTAIRPLPLLWVIPLALYLFSFAIVFSPVRRPPQALLRRIFPFLALPALGLALLSNGQPFWLQSTLHMIAFFGGALLCHGELAADRPPTHQLTSFYLLVAVGGALGGVFAAVISPVLLKDLYEYPLAIVAAALLLPTPGGERRKRILDLTLPGALLLVGGVLLWALQASGTLGRLASVPFTPTTSGLDVTRLLLIFAVPALAVALFLRRPRRFAFGLLAILALDLLPFGSGTNVLYQDRSFFGVSKVLLEPGRHVLLSGATIHGLQLLDPERRDIPTSYYAHSGPVGDVFRNLPADGDWPVAVVGLGAGGMSCYARPRQTWTFYEIDPVVVRIATDPRLFTFLRDCPGENGRIVLGDGRITLARADAASYGLIALDAFANDAPPVHLLTRDAVALYLTKLREGGVLLFNISNRYVNLRAVLGNVAQSLGLAAYERVDVEVTPAQAAQGKYISDWVVMARSPNDLAAVVSQRGWAPLPPDPRYRTWTDDYSDLLSVIAFG